MDRYPKSGPEDPSSLYLEPDRYERANIPPGAPPKQKPYKRVHNFNEVFLGYDEEQAVVEAMRCIHCPSPEPCILGCPVHNDIPGALLAIEQGRYIDAAMIFRNTSNLPEVCGRICPQEILCEGSCTVAGNDRAVNIGKLEAFCSDWQRKSQGFPIPLLAAPTGYRVAIVGSGPAGLAVAEQLTIAGHECVVYEEWPLPGGLLVYGIPGFKLSKQIVADKCSYLESIGVKFICNVRVGRDLQVEDLLNDYDSVFLGVGAPVGNPAKLPGEDLKGIYQATEWLVRGNLPADLLPERLKGHPEVGKHIAVIGGGDTSSDCVRTGRRLQAMYNVTDGKVVDYYRRTEAEMPGREEERMHAKEEGVIYEFLVAPVRFIGDDQGHVRELELERMRLGPPDSSGRRSPVRIEGSNFRVPADIIVLAIGYSGDPTIPAKTPALKTRKAGIFQVETEETGKTTLERVYAAGDDVRGADLVVTAVAAARHAARAMDDYMRTVTPKHAPAQRWEAPVLVNAE